MKVLGVNGSPRQNGNSHYLMSAFMDEIKAKGHDTQVLDATAMKINRCIGCGSCETKGGCIFKDEFTHIFLPAVIEADILVLSSPVYFYAFPADIKALIDRIQVLWSRKYRLKTNEFKGRDRKGVLLAVGATRGKDLFSGMEQTARYFFDAAGMAYAGALCYRGIDGKGEMEQHPGLLKDIQNLVQKLGL
ncbi:MAG: flavodoxin family protein [Pseudomonadota bacterium]